MTTLSNFTDYSKETKTQIASRSLVKYGYANQVKNGTILITSKISDSDLEELTFVFANETIKRQ